MFVSREIKTFNTISAMFLVLVFGLLFYVKNDWCDLLFKNFTVSETIDHNHNFELSFLEENITFAPLHHLHPHGCHHCFHDCCHHCCQNCCHHHRHRHHNDHQENISCAPRHFQKKGGTLLGRSKMARRVLKLMTMTGIQSMLTIVMMTIRAHCWD